MQQRICSNKEARSLKIRPRGAFQITANTLLRVPVRFPPKTRNKTCYERATRRAIRVQQDALRACNNTHYDGAIDAPRACNTTRYMCATTHYGVRESGALHDTGELPGALHDTGELTSALHDTGELPHTHDTGEVPSHC